MTQHRRLLSTLFILIVCLLTLRVLPVQAATESIKADDIIVKALDPSRHIGYIANQVLTVHSNNTYHSIAIKVYCSPTQMVKLEYTDTNGYPYKVILDNGKESLYYEINNKMAFRTRSTYKAVTRVTPKIMSLILKNFNISIGKPSILSNRPVYTLEIRSKKDHKIVRKLWIDKIHYVILKSEEYKDNRLVNASYFTTINYKKTFDKKVFTLTIPDNVSTTYTPSGSDIFSLSELKKMQRFNPNIPAYLPDGYVFTSAHIDTNAVCLRFSNGLNTISLYEALGNYKHHSTKIHNSKYILVNGFRAQLSKLSQNTILMWKTTKIKYTLIGDLSRDDAIKIANSLPYSKQEIKLPFWKILYRKIISFLAKMMH